MVILGSFCSWSEACLPGPQRAPRRAQQLLVIVYVTRFVFKIKGLHQEVLERVKGQASAQRQGTSAERKQARLLPPSLQPGGSRGVGRQGRGASGVSTHFFAF